jgi:SAM-dependent methyltransferase/uncharacterized protein YbaR (Trm112 family)
MELQNIDNLKGEIGFRQKLAKQHVTGEILLPEYYNKEEHDKILLERVTTTLKEVKYLEKRGVILSPFIELGAERCQRSLVLTNDFNAGGFAVDISYHQLKTAAHFSKVFDRPKLPYRVCCDVNNLPFRSNSFPFVFCYEFLHHFPSPEPILHEAYRIMSDGTFFFNEEPFKRPGVVLYRQKPRRCFKSKLRKNRTIRAIEKLFSEQYCDEREHGIIENNNISLREWIDALSVFDTKEVYVSSLVKKIRTVLRDRIALRNIPNMLLGGEIEGICTKKSTARRNETADLTDMLLCPNCMIKSKDHIPNQPPLRKSANSLECSLCASIFPVIDGVTFLLPTALFRELYPGIADRQSGR